MNFSEYHRLGLIFRAPESEPLHMNSHANTLLSMDEKGVKKTETVL